ncbi:MAG: protein kinase, partial [Dokdonella sp.]
MKRGAHDLLEPGVLLSGRLFRDLVQSRSVDALAVGARLGAFRVVRELGRGGMGVVHLAERDDGEFSQQVALKCMADRASAAGTELFRRERQILASLRHPNIARLLDGGGAEDGLLWFAMEWVEGERIDVHCARRALTLDDRLRLWIGVAAAVQFAHTRLLIHRDIKPGNVLVDVDGQPRLLDFGIATLLGDSGGPRAYSPGHASPEQRAGGDVGTASDQYQLGLLLDAMLSSHRAADHSATSGLVSVARSTHSTTSSGIANGVQAAAGLALRFSADRWIAMPRVRRGELRSVLARACAIDPATRYGSVAELKADVERIIAREPIDSRRGRWLHVVVCAGRRRPWTALVAAAAAVAVVVVVVVFNLRLAHQRDLAQAESAKVKAINAFVNEDLLASANPFEASRSDLTMREALDIARDRVGSRFADQPLIESELRQTLGKTYVGVGDLAAAKAQLQQALRLRGTVDRSLSVESVEIRLLLVQCAIAASEHADAERQVRSLLDELALARTNGDAQRLRATIALVEVLGFLGRGDEALALDTSLSGQLDVAADGDPLRLEYADVRGHLLLSLGRAEEAFNVFDSAVRHAVALAGA